MAQEQIQQKKSEQVKELLNKATQENKIAYWKIDSGKSRRQNIYMQKDFVAESQLESVREDSHITIYKNFDDEDKIGESSFTLNSQDTIDEFEKELEDAIYITSHSKSQKYELPQKDDKNIEDFHIDYDIFYNKKFKTNFENGELIKHVEEKINLFKSLIEKNQEDGFNLILNSLEIFNKLSDINFESSAEIKKSYTKNSTYLEFIMTISNEETGEEIEHIVYESINDIYDFDFEEFFVRHIRFVQDKIAAKDMNDFKGKVILKDFAAYDFFIPSPQNCSPILHSSARLKFFGLSKYEKGKPAIDSKLDKFTLYSNPLRVNNAYSTPFDGLGISAKRICLVKDSMFENYFASKQYGDYIGAEATGPVGSFEIDGGSKSFKEFYDEKEDVVEILAFAWFAPDVISGDVSAEIRLGYIVKSDGTRTPFKGGLLSGNLFDLLEEAEFSKEMVEKPGYYGPQVIKFHKAEIVGNN